jgi:hypothetical protein
MKIGFFSESPADQAALAVFTGAILGAPPEPINMSLEAHGCTGVLSALDGVIKGLHYHSDAEALVVVVDCNGTEAHSATHDKPDNSADDCRLCQARKIAAKARGRLSKRPAGPALKIAIGLAVPAIEAWYLFGKDHAVGEAAWHVALTDRRDHVKKKHYRQQLKKRHGSKPADLG